jgi:hypothetical protein
MEIAVVDDVDVQADDHTGEVRSGVVIRKWLLTGEAEDGLRFRFFQSKYQEGSDAFESPRHHHAFQQIRWTQSGSVNFAPDQDIPEGDIAYFPRGTFYGPQRKDQGVGLLLQFGIGPELPISRYQMEKAGLDDTSEQGRHDGDVVVAKRPKITVPAEGYEAPILMHPQAYAYYDAGPGLEIKHLGGYYDHPGPNGDVRISIIRLQEGGVFRLSAERAQLGWSTADGLQVEGRTYPALTSFHSPRGEEATISGVGGVEVCLVEFPRLD